MYKGLKGLTACVRVWFMWCFPIVWPWMLEFVSECYNWPWLLCRAWALDFTIKVCHKPGFGNSSQKRYRTHGSWRCQSVVAISLRFPQFSNRWIVDARCQLDDTGWRRSQGPMGLCKVMHFLATKNCKRWSNHQSVHASHPKNKHLFHAWRTTSRRVRPTAGGKQVKLRDFVPGVIPPEKCGTAQNMWLVWGST